MEWGVPFAPRRSTLKRWLWKEQKEAKDWEIYTMYAEGVPLFLSFSSSFRIMKMFRFRYKIFQLSFFHCLSCFPCAAWRESLDNKSTCKKRHCDETRFSEK